jgi:hypothetical protein
MAQYGRLQNYRFTEAAEDIRGSHLYGRNDEKLGEIDDVIFDHSTASIRYVVVDTGGWLSTKKFLVPADRLRSSTDHKDDFAVDLTKKQVEGFPPYNESDLESEAQWGDYEGRYRSKWENSPVMHREGTDRNITPTTQQMTGNLSSERAADAASGDATFVRSEVTTPIQETASGEGIGDEIEDTGAFETGGFAASTDSVEISQSANGIGPRWDTFQDRLRERRKEVINTGSTYRKAS